MNWKVVAGIVGGIVIGLGVAIAWLAWAFMGVVG